MEANFTLESSEIEAIFSIGGGRSSINDHNQLINRDLENQHPISAITNLQNELDDRQGKLVAGSNIEIDENNQISATIDESNLVHLNGEEEISDKTLVNSSIKDQLLLKGDPNKGETFLVDFLDNTAQISTNNGLDFLSNVNFSKIPTTETKTTYDELLVNQFVNKQHVAQAINNISSVTDYEKLNNLPSINNVELKGNKTLSELGATPSDSFNNLTTEVDSIRTELTQLHADFDAIDLGEIANKAEDDMVVHKKGFSGLEIVEGPKSFTNIITLEGNTNVQIGDVTNTAATTKFVTDSINNLKDDLPSPDSIDTKISDHNISDQSHTDIRNLIKSNSDDILLKANKSDVYTKEQVDAKISSVYRFCGSVASYNNLPQSDQVIGDTYNVEDTGANYAWTGTLWDKLSETIDLTNYATTENVNSSIAEHNLSSQSHNDIRNSVKSVSDSLAGKANLASQENTKIGNIAVVDKDGQYEVSDTKLSDLNADIGTLNTQVSGLNTQVSENTTKLASCVTSSTVTNITQITQAEYDTLANKDSTTLYIIIG